MICKVGVKVRRWVADPKHLEPSYVATSEVTPGKGTDFVTLDDVLTAITNLAAGESPLPFTQQDIHVWIESDVNRYQKTVAVGFFPDPRESGPLPDEEIGIVQDLVEIGLEELADLAYGK